MLRLQLLSLGSVLVLGAALTRAAESFDRSHAAWTGLLAAHVRWNDAGSETRFLAASRAAGVLFKRGAYDYAALAHDDEEAITAIGHAAAAGFDAVRKLDAE